MGRSEVRRVLGVPEAIAIGVGGMIGGGIFSILGIAVERAGSAAPISFLVASAIACVTAYGYVWLGLSYRDDGASFTYLQRAFPAHPWIACIEGWTVLVGYVGTLALYAFTFGAYGGDLLGFGGDGVVRGVLAVAVLGFFVVVNLHGVRSSGISEDLVVYAKIFILAAFGVIGWLRLPMGEAFSRSLAEATIQGVFGTAAIIFVAFEGFQLVNNAVDELRDPEHDLPRGVFGAIAVTSTIYVMLAAIAVAAPDREQLLRAGEYALAVVADPVLGKAGHLLIGLAALLATSSAINATLFGAARMAAIMAERAAAPRWLSRRSARGVPSRAVLGLAVAALALVFWGGLDFIAAFSSSTFLLVSFLVTLAAYRLGPRIGARRGWLSFGLVLIATTIAGLWGELLATPQRLRTVMVLYVATWIGALLYRPRGR